MVSHLPFPSEIPWKCACLPCLTLEMYSPLSRHFTPTSFPASILLLCLPKLNIASLLRIAFPPISAHTKGLFDRPIIYRLDYDWIANFTQHSLVYSLVFPFLLKPTTDSPTLVTTISIAVSSYSMMTLSPSRSIITLSITWLPSPISNRPWPRLHLTQPSTPPSLLSPQSIQHITILSISAASTTRHRRLFRCTRAGHFVYQ